MNTTTQSKEKEEQTVMGSLSLRDYFAARAMAAFIVGSAVSKESACDLDIVSELAYKQADAMLAERSKK